MEGYGGPVEAPVTCLMEDPGQTGEKGDDTIIGENRPEFPRTDERHKPTGSGSIRNLKQNTQKTLNSRIHYEEVSEP